MFLQISPSFSLILGLEIRGMAAFFLSVNIEYDLVGKVYYLCEMYVYEGVLFLPLNDILSLEEI